MEISFNPLKSSQIYHLMIQTVVPRPIAWVMSRNEDQSYNLAPFSYFNAVSSDPPLLMFSVGHKSTGEKKDTWRNIERDGEFVIHIPSVELAQAVTGSAQELKFGESEVTRLGLETVPFGDKGWRRLKSAQIAFLCRKERILEVGNAPQGVVFAEVEKVFLDDAIVYQENSRLKVDVEKLNPLARLGGADYAALGSIFSVPRL